LGATWTTAATIADEAGVTERTFFRYFPTKADALVANWQHHADALRETLATSTRAKLVDVVGDALKAFTDRLQVEPADLRARHRRDAPAPALLRRPGEVGATRCRCRGASSPGAAAPEERTGARP
jgi:AcrR family transcriptional regulator